MEDAAVVAELIWVKDCARWCQQADMRAGRVNIEASDERVKLHDELLLWCQIHQDGFNISAMSYLSSENNV